MKAPTPPCPRCTSARTVRNGHIHNGKQNHKCKNCGRQFVEAPQNKVISLETKELIDKLLLEKLPLAGIPESLMFLSRGYRATSTRSTKWFLGKSGAGRKKGTLKRRV